MVDISKNKLFHHDGAPAGKALGGMLAVNSTLQELDVSDNAERPSSEGGSSFAQALRVGISGNGALTSLNLASNNIGGYYTGNKGSYKSKTTPKGM